MVASDDTQSAFLRYLACRIDREVLLVARDHQSKALAVAQIRRLTLLASEVLDPEGIRAWLEASTLVGNPFLGLDLRADTLLPLGLRMNESLFARQRVPP